MEAKTGIILLIHTAITIGLGILCLFDLLHVDFFILSSLIFFIIISVRYYALQNKGISGVLMVTVSALLTVLQIAIMVR